ncbi:MAG: ammonia-forming cytochrome c nitrite reductase subunit c552 [Promethearchaeota archaeon]
MDTLDNFSELKEQSRWSGKRVVLLYWMALLFLGTGVAVGLGTQVLNPRYQMAPKFDHSTITEPWHPDDCSGCHPTEHTEWLDTMHGSGVTDNGTHIKWSTRAYNYTAFAASSCAHCLSTRYNATDQTYWDIGITCAACHDAGVVNHSPDNCGQCHSGGSHAIYEDHMISKHNDSLADCLASGHPSDSCMACVSGQSQYWPGGYPTVEYNLWVNNTDLTGITCATCHDPHDGTNDLQLREDNSLDLCGACHGSTSRHSDYEQFTDTTYEAEHEGECIDCHGYDAVWQDLDHNSETGVDGKEAFAFNHTWFMDLPDACNVAGCHNDTPRTMDDIEDRQADVATKYTEYTTLLATVQAKVDEANETDDIDQDEVDAAYTLIDDAGDLAQYYISDGSSGFHNPEFMKAKLDAAITKLNDAQSKAEDAIDKAGEEDGLIPGFEFASLILAISILGVAVLYLRKRHG